MTSAMSPQQALDLYRGGSSIRMHSCSAGGLHSHMQLLSIGLKRRRHFCSLQLQREEKANEGETPAADGEQKDQGIPGRGKGREEGLLGERLPFGRFENLDISERSRSRLRTLELETLSPIQRKTFQPIMEGRDIIAKAPTGTGKTLAYCLPVLERLLLMPPRGRAPARPSWLVLVPTRELAQQVLKELNSIGDKRLTSLLAVGGVAMDPQIEVLKRGVDVVVATPGRAVDLLRARQMALFDLRVLVLDEADQMLEAGFAQELDYILESVPRDVRVQTLLFCATFPRRLLETAERICHRPLRVQTSEEEEGAERESRARSTPSREGTPR